MKDKNKEITEAQRIEFEFAKLLAKKFDDYKDRLADKKTIGDREFRHMASAIHGCKLVIQGVLNEGENFEVKLK